MKKRILAYAVIILLAGYIYSDYAKAESDNTPLACIPEASGGLTFNQKKINGKRKGLILQRTLY